MKFTANKDTALGGGITLQKGDPIDLPEAVGDKCPDLDRADEVAEEVTAPPTEPTTPPATDPVTLPEGQNPPATDGEGGEESTGEEGDEEPAEEVAEKPADEGDAGESEDAESAPEGTEDGVEVAEEVAEKPAEEEATEVVPDDLTALPHIGDAGQRKLNEAGVFTYRQVALADDAIIDAISNRIGADEVKAIKAKAEELA